MRLHARQRPSAPAHVQQLARMQAGSTLRRSAAGTRATPGTSASSGACTHSQASTTDSNRSCHSLRWSPARRAPAWEAAAAASSAPDSWRAQRVVILGSGAFGLEAMEAANRAGAASITLVMRRRDRCARPHPALPLEGGRPPPPPFPLLPSQRPPDGLRRWIVPYSEQFRFIWLSSWPLVPKRMWAAWINKWLAEKYSEAGIQHVQPEPGSACNFTGQCNDAFFQLPLQVVPPAPAPCTGRAAAAQRLRLARRAG